MNEAIHDVPLEIVKFPRETYRAKSLPLWDLVAWRYLLCWIN